MYDAIYADWVISVDSGINENGSKFIGFIFRTNTIWKINSLSTQPNYGEIEDLAL